MIEINISKKIYDIVNEYPDVKDIMTEIGFADIAKPGTLQSAGRIMTLEKGARIKNIPLEEIEETFKKYGYMLVEEETK